MVDPFDLIDSITATAGIARAATKLSKSLLRTAREAGTISDDIRTFAMDIGAFSSVVLLAHNSLREHCSRQSNSDVLKYINDLQILDQLAAQSVHLIERIELIRPRIESIRSRLDLICRFRWLRRKPEVQDIGLRMQSVKMNLLLVIHVVALEVSQYQKRPVSRDTRREIKNLKRQIRIQMKAASILQTRLEQSNFEKDYEEHLSYSSHRRDVQNALLALAESMIGDRGIPPPTRSSSSSNGKGNDFGMRRHTRHRRRSTNHRYQRPSSVRSSSPSVLRPTSATTRNTQAAEKGKESQDDQSTRSFHDPDLDELTSRPHTSHAEVGTKDPPIAAG